MDGRLANPVRSGRKQPQRVTARVVCRSPTFPHAAGPCATLAAAQTSGDRPACPACSRTTQSNKTKPPPPPEGPGLFGDALPVALPEPVHATPYRVLARKYRPTTFDDLIGQEAMVRTLRNAFAVGRVAHAFMLTGVRGVGKTTTARIIARALNCIGAGRHRRPDRGPVRRLRQLHRHPRRPPSRRDRDGRRQPHRRRRHARGDRGDPLPPDAGSHQGLRHRRGPYAEPQRLQRAAENAGRTAAARQIRLRHDGNPQSPDHRPVALPALRPPPRAHRRTVGLFARIAVKENVTIEPAALEQIARSADGSVRDGLSMLDQAIAQAEGHCITSAQVVDMLGLADREAVFELMDAVMGGKPAAALAITDRAYERGADLGTLLQDLLDLLHTVTRLKSVPSLRRKPGIAGSRTHARRGTGRPAERAGAGPRLADAAEGRRRGGNRPRPPRRGRDGADPPLPCLRHADAGRPDPPPGVGSARSTARRRPVQCPGAVPVERRWRSPCGRSPTARR